MRVIKLKPNTITTDARASRIAVRKKSSNKNVNARPAKSAANTAERLPSIQDNPPEVLTVLGQFRLIFRSAKKHFQLVEEKTGVSGAQLWALAEVQRNPGIRVTELARSMAIHQSTASNLIEKLEKRGLVAKVRSSTDQRVVSVKLTESGSQTLGRAPMPIKGVLPDALNAISHEELTSLHHNLSRVVQLMKIRDKTGQRIPLSDI